METRHTIEEFVFELCFDDLAPAADFETGLHDWLRQDLLPPFEALFDSLSGPDETVHLDSLEIDLGDLPYENLRHELPLRLMEKLRAALEECLALRRGRATELGSAGAAGKARRTDAQELLDFLAHGRLPWQASADRLAAHERLLARVAEQDAAALLRGIADSAQRATMIERLARQFPSVRLLELARQAAPAHGPLMAQLIELIPTDALPSFWEAAFKVLLDHQSDGAQGSARELVERIAARLARSLAWESLRTNASAKLRHASGLEERRLLGAVVEALSTEIPAHVDANATEPAPTNVSAETSITVSTAEAIGASANTPASSPPGVLAIELGGLESTWQALRDRRIGLHELDMDSADMSRLVGFFIERDAVSGIGNRVAFLRAIEEHGAQAQQKGKFFKLVLQSLLDGKLVDLEAFVRASLDADSASSSALPARRTTSPEAAAAAKAGFAATGRASYRPSTAEAAQKSPDEPATPAGQPAEDDGPLRFRLAHCLLNGDVAQLESIWHLLYRRHAGLTREALLHYGKFERVQRRFALDYPDAMLRDFIELIEPRALASVAFLTGQAATLAQAEPVQWKRGVWDAAFAFLLRDGAASFSRSALAEFLLQRITAKEAAHYPDRRSAVLAWSGKLRGEGPPELQLAAWRLAIAHVRADDDADPIGDVLLARLIQSLKRQHKEANETAPSLAAAVEIVFAARPRLLLPLIEAYRRGELPALPVALGQAQLRKLLLAWGGLMRPPGEAGADTPDEDPVAFVDRVGVRAEESGAAAAYLRAVLERLREGRHVDSASLDAVDDDLKRQGGQAVAADTNPEQARAMQAVWRDIERKAVRVESLAAWRIQDLAALLDTAFAFNMSADAAAGARMLAAIERRAAGRKQIYLLALERLADGEQLDAAEIAALADSRARVDRAQEKGEANGTAAEDPELTSEAELVRLIEQSGKKVFRTAKARQAFHSALSAHLERSLDRHALLHATWRQMREGKRPDFGLVAESGGADPEALRGHVLQALGRRGEQELPTPAAALLQLRGASIESLSRIGATELTILIERYLESVALADAGNRRLFMDTAAKEARRAGNRKHFLALVLSRLVHNAAVDFDDILARSSMLPDVATITTESAGAHDLAMQAASHPVPAFTVAAKTEPADASPISSTQSLAEVRANLTREIAQKAMDAGRRAAFLHAIEHHAQLAGDRRTFYNLVREAVEKDEAVDLEAFVYRSRAPAEVSPVAQAGRAENTQQTATGGWEPFESADGLEQGAGRETEQRLGQVAERGADITQLRAALAEQIARQSTNEERRGTFIHSIENHALMAADRRRFYALVLDAVSKGEAVDLEAYVEQSAIPESVASVAAGAVMPPALRDALERNDAENTEATLREVFARKLHSFEQVRGWFADGETGRRLFGLLSPDAASRVFSLLLGRDYREIERLAEMVADAVVFVSGRIPREVAAKLRRQAIFELLLARRAVFVPEQFLANAAGLMAREAGIDQEQLVQELVEARFAPERAQQIANQSADAAANASSAGSAAHATQEIPPVSDATLSNVDVHVENAGLVLAWPYLPRLFAMLNLMEKNVFVDAKAAERAVHLLQFMATGETHTPEYALVLNKQLCGVATGVPIAGGIDITDTERETIENLLHAMIAHWKILGNTSIAGFRESFLQRQGWLTLQEEVWHLRVQTRAYDMLLDQLPWGISMVKHLWMPRPIHVKWR